MENMDKQLYIANFIFKLSYLSNAVRCTYDQVLVDKQYLHLEPIGIVLVFFFFAIVIIQFVAMLFHR